MITYKPISQLLAIVKNDFSSYQLNGVIDDGVLIKTILYCNDKLGLLVREVREKCLVVNDYKAELPLDFEKLYYSCALQATNTQALTLKNPFDNNVDQDIIYEARLDRDSLGNVDAYKVVIERETNTTVYTRGNWIELGVDSQSDKYCQIDCPNKKRKGKYTITIQEDYIDTPFKSGLLYVMYIGTMKDENGEMLFPFHTLITPYYEWSLKEKIIMNLIFNTEGDRNLGELLKLCQLEKAKDWLDAFNFTSDRTFGQMVALQKKKEYEWYSKYFKFFQ